MVTVTILTPPMQEKIVVEVPDDTRTTLLSLLKRFNMPTPCVCGEGRCGSCAVKVVPQRKWAKQIVLSEQEKRNLLQAGKLSLEESEAQQVKDIPPRWRLACQFIVHDEPILIAF